MSFLGVSMRLGGILERIGNPFGLVDDKRVYVDAGCGIVVSAYIPRDSVIEDGERCLEERIVCQTLKNSAGGDALFHVELCDTAIGKYAYTVLSGPATACTTVGKYPDCIEPPGMVYLVSCGALLA